MVELSNGQEQLLGIAFPTEEENHNEKNKKPMKKRHFVGVVNWDFGRGLKLLDAKILIYKLVIVNFLIIIIINYYAHEE